MSGREVVLRADHRRIDDERAGGQHALGAAAAAPLLDELDQAGALELAQVVVDALARQAELGGETRRRRGLAQPPQQRPAQRREGRADALGVVQQLDDAVIIDWTGEFVKSSCRPRC
jgi:hypothetical protein